MADHGINVSRADTAVATPNAATCGIPFVIGTAPLFISALLLYIVHFFAGFVNQNFISGTIFQRGLCVISA